MTVTDWFSLLHPVLIILFVYPVVGATIRLGILARERRLKINPLPPTVGVEHADHGRWVTSGVVVAVLIALLYSFLSKFLEPGAAFAGGTPRLALLLLVSAGTLASLLALWRVKKAPYRASFALLTWAGVLGLGSQSEIWRLSDNPLSGAFWGSHYWAGVLLTGLLLFATAAKQEIFKSMRFRRLHVSAGVLTAVLLAVLAITGTRDLLEIPLSWQKSAIYACNFEQRTCPTPPPAPAAPATSSLPSAAPWASAPWAASSSSASA
jgi:hypothetical protein